MRIVQLSDFHLTADPAQRLKNVPTHDALRDVLAFIESRRIAFDFALLTGDLTHDGEEVSYRALRGLLGDWLPKCRLIPGNHDRRGPLRRVLAEIVPAARGPLTFSLAAGSWQLIGLDSLQAGSDSGRLGADQLVWLEDELWRHAQRPTVLFVHHPPVPIGCEWLDRIGLEAPDAFVELVSASPQVRAICCGHVHLEFEGRIGETKVLTCPSTAVQFAPLGDSSAYEASPPGFRLLDLEGGALRSEVVRLPEVKYPPEA